MMCQLFSSPKTARPSCQRVLLLALSLLLFFIECRCSAMPASAVMINVGSNGFQPIEVLKRLPGAVLESSKESIISFGQTAGVVIPAGLIWKLGTLRTSGMKAWAMEGGKMGVEWGRFSALYSGGMILFARMRGVEDKWNSYIACGICSAASKVQEGPRAIVQEFATGFAFVYALDKLTGMVGDGSIEGRQAIEGAVGSKAKAQSLAQARSMRAKTFIAKNKNPKLGNLPKRKF